MMSEERTTFDLGGLTSPVQVVTKIMQTTAFQNFFNKISQSGFLLFVSALFAFLWSNIDGSGYRQFWNTEFAISFGSFVVSHSLVDWINDGLMTVFFLVVGLEIKREMLIGSLSDPKLAALPVAAALGGMVAPACIYVFFNHSGVGVEGWGIPMATDIAFSLAVLSILGRSLPFGVRIFLTAFAIADDLGAIIVIALFYTPEIHFLPLSGAVALVILLFIFNKLRVRHWLPYIIIGLFLWGAAGAAGLHATIAGVITAMFIPSKGKYNTDLFLEMVERRLEKLRCTHGPCGQSVRVNRAHLCAVQEIELACKEVETPLQRLEHGLSSWVGYLVLPLFSLANAGVTMSDINLVQAFIDPVTIGIIFGLVLGKPAGIFFFTYGTARLLHSKLIKGTTWPMIFGAGMLGGIGFTMSLFISGLSFVDPLLLDYTKLGIVAGSFISAAGGYTVLRLTLRKI